MASTFTPEDLEAYLAAACGLLNEAAGIQKAVGVPPEQNLLHMIADALYTCWSAREKIHAFRPDMVLASISQVEDSPQIYADFVALCSRTQPLELAGDSRAALAEYDAFVLANPTGYCQRVAGLHASMLRASVEHAATDAAPKSS